MDRLFPLITSRHRSRKTLVVWDTEGYSIPESIHPFSIRKQIESAIEVEGSYGPVSILLYGPENTWSSNLEDKLWKAGFKVHLVKVPGLKSATFNLMIADVASWAFVVRSPSNVLILSQNDIELQYPKFSTLREALGNKGFAVASAHPQTLINQDIRCDCASKLTCDFEPRP